MYAAAFGLVTILIGPDDGMGRAEGAACGRPLPHWVPRRQAGATPERFSSSGGCTASYGFFRCTVK